MTTWSACPGRIAAQVMFAGTGGSEKVTAGAVSSPRPRTGPRAVPAGESPPVSRYGRRSRSSGRGRHPRTGGGDPVRQTAGLRLPDADQRLLGRVGRGGDPRPVGREATRSKGDASGTLKSAGRTGEERGSSAELVGRSTSTRRPAWSAALASGIRTSRSSSRKAPEVQVPGAAGRCGP